MHLSPTQFLIILVCNGLFVWAFLGHYFSESVRTVVQHDPVYKDRVVNKCVTTESYKDLMEAATNHCNQGSSSGLKTFSIDANNRPVVACKTQ